MVERRRAAARTEDKRRRILEAATSLFSRYGFRRASVELIAAEAGVAKPTLYAYFTDKEAVFRAVIEDVCDTLLAGAEEARARDASIEERLLGVLSAKFGYLYELVHASPHAAEILDSQSRLGAEVVQRADRAYQKLLSGLLEEAIASRALDARRVDASPSALAATLIRCAHGAAHDATSAASHRRHLAEMVKLFVAALRP